MSDLCFFFFFFQAEDGIRDWSVTGVQTCALPISSGLAYDGRVKPDVVAPGVALETSEPGSNADGTARYGTVNGTRSEERRVGKECRSRGGAEEEKKKKDDERKCTNSTKSTNLRHM